ncbi:nicotinate-nucleotide adenylyltransferase [Paraglaciecola sp. L3A3]|uniref:nicotinate-nucleotide adenylyltransferase n=1 Tax=Paraglaciecola sp. L3A3 TaxID=2686358 RepID=UPI00131C3826|nr:nicotinate-nucleotide adenylyltransferase [Paraglaciecola sp. L3A3]
MLNAPLGIFGGTFDPIHKGHIYPVLEAANITEINKIAMIPCYIPSHKSAACVSSEHRLKMIELICDEHPILYPDARDINRGVATYSVETLSELRAEFPTRPLCFFIGSDSLQTLLTWHKWQQILSLCHFVVCTRQETTTCSSENMPQDQALQDLLQQRQTNNPVDLHNNLAGHIFLANTQPLTMSSTLLRKQLEAGKSVEELIPSSILTYIHQHKLYQPSNDLC